MHTILSSASACPIDGFPPATALAGSQHSRSQLRGSCDDGAPEGGSSRAGQGPHCHGHGDGCYAVLCLMGGCGWGEKSSRADVGRFLSLLGSWQRAQLDPARWMDGWMDLLVRKQASQENSSVLAQVYICSNRGGISLDTMVHLSAVFFPASASGFGHRIERDILTQPPWSSPWARPQNRPLTPVDHLLLMARRAREPCRAP